jgi:hypothetical protein
MVGDWKRGVQAGRVGLLLGVDIVLLRGWSRPRMLFRVCQTARSGSAIVPSSRSLS